MDICIWNIGLVAIEQLWKNWVWLYRLLTKCRVAKLIWIAYYTHQDVGFPNMWFIFLLVEVSGRYGFPQFNIEFIDYWSNELIKKLRFSELVNPPKGENRIQKNFDRNYFCLLRNWENVGRKKNFRRNGFSRAVLERDFLEPNPFSRICIYRREIFPENLVALRCVVVLILAIMSVNISHSDSCQHNIARTAVLRYDYVGKCASAK